MDAKKLMNVEPRLSVGDVGVVGSDVPWGALGASATAKSPCDMVDFTYEDVEQFANRVHDTRIYEYGGY